MQQSRFVAAAAWIAQGAQGGALREGGLAPKLRGVFALLMGELTLGLGVLTLKLGVLILALGVLTLTPLGVLTLTPLGVLTLTPLGMPAIAHAAAVDARQIFAVAPQKPVDSELKVKVGDVAPDFALPGVDGNTVQLASFRGRQAVVLSFVPAAFTPVCSGQWPGYDLLRDEFEKRNATLIGITTDNVASLYAWTRQMGTDAAGEPTGVWFPVVSDFWPHGATAARYGLLRSDGTTERALIVVDRQGIIRFIHVADINRRPPIDPLFKALDGLKP